MGEKVVSAETASAEAVAALKELKIIAEENDPEDAHSKADGVLCDLLRKIGLGDVADAYDAIEPKWYA